MATQVKPKSEQASPRQTKVQQYVDRQLEKTRRQVKALDLASGLIALVAGILAYFLVVAIIDAWIWPLGTTGRVMALGILILGVLAYSFSHLLPLLLRKINPTFAAKMIEDSKPTFKNSLINYLSLRKSPAAAHRAVVDAVANRAATDLSSVPEDSTVDRSNVIRVGFILVAIAVAAVAYMILSPKNPLHTVRRILAPTAKIAKPAVVQISAVEPGDTRVFFGETLMVSARVKGRHDPNDVRIVFSTDDGQMVDSRILMEAEAAGRYLGELKTDPSGIQQPLRYRVVARDGVSPEYAVSVRPVPTISVGAVKITPPAYTKIPERVLEGQGDIQALEGSEITVHAMANLPIQLAYIELLQPLSGDADSVAASDYKVVRTVNMSSDGQEAHGSFDALLNTKRTKPSFTHYRIRFVSTEDDRNQSPIVYPVRITPDLAPEIAIITPETKVRSVPANEALPIEIEANDLDFEISSVDLHIDHQGSKIYDRDLKLETVQGNQRVEARFELVPEKLNLKPGDRAVFFATAADNRTSTTTGQLDPNISRTENYTIVVIAPKDKPDQDPEEQQPDPRQQEQRQPKQPGERDNQQPDRDDPREQESNQDPADPQTSDDQTSDEQSSDQGGSEGSDMSQGESETGDQGDSSTGQSSDAADPGEQGEPGEEGSDNDSGDSEQGESAGDGDSDQSESSEEGGQQGGSSSDQADSQTGDQQGASQGNSGDSQAGSGEDRTGDNQTGQGDSESGNSSASQQMGDAQSGGAESDGAGDAAQQGGRNESLGDGEVERIQDNASEREQFDKLKELLKDLENQENSGENTSDSSATESDSTDQQTSESSGNNASEQTGDSQEQSQSDSDAADQQGESSSDPGAQESGNESGSSEGSQADEGEMDQQSGDSSDSQSEASSDRQSGDPSDQQSGKTSGGDSAEKQQGGAETGEEPSKQQGDSSGEPSDQQGNQQQGESSGQSGDSSDQQGDQQGESSEDKATSSDQQGEAGTGGDSETSEQSGTGGNDSQQEGGSGSQGESGNMNQQQPGEQADPQGSGQSDQSSKEGQPAGGQGEEQTGQDGDQEGASGQEKTGDDSQRDSQSGSQSDTDSQSQSGSQSEGGSQPGGSGDSPASKQGAQSSGGTDSPETTGSDQTGGGVGNTANAPLPQEEANLEYARKATDLILDRLQNQKNEPDPELLEKMNWTQKDLEQFVKRWAEMRQRARAGDEQAQRQYREALQSLGFTTRQVGPEQLNQRRDDQTGLAEDGAVDTPPARFQERYRQFRRDLNRSGKKRSP